MPRLTRIIGYDINVGVMNDIAMHRLFSAGLCPEAALRLMGDHPGAGRFRKRPDRASR